MEEEQFIHIVAEQLKVDHDSAEKIISAAFHELHDRLTTKEAADVEAQMPGKLRSLWGSFELPGREVKRIHKTEFERKVAELARISEIDAPHAVRVVFGTLPGDAQESHRPGRRGLGHLQPTPEGP